MFRTRLIWQLYPSFLAVTLVAAGLGEVQTAVLKSAFARPADNDLRKNPPDREQIPDRVGLKAEKKLGADAFSAGCHYSLGWSGAATLDLPDFAREVAAAKFNPSPYVLASVFYLMLTIPLGRFVARLEDKLAESEGGGGGKRPPTVPSAVDAKHEVAHREGLADMGG